MFLQYFYPKQLSMRITLKYILFSILVMASFFINAQTNFETTSWELVKEKATNDNKLIFVDLYFTDPTHRVNTFVYIKLINHGLIT